ncbi:MAG: DUF5069 domain-containing protein [Nibricoccus sp.]
MAQIPKRRPTNKLAGCMWLARLTKKIRLHLAGELDASFHMPFCHPLATDGVFFKHFELTKDEIIQAVQSSNGDDEKVASWFLGRSADVSEKIASWNQVAPQIGRPGFPGERILAFAKKNVYKGPDDSRLDSIFLLLAADEGYLDEMLAMEKASVTSAP